MPPAGQPLMYELDAGFMPIKSHRPGDEEAIKKAMEAVVPHVKAK